jgi:steroid delta-isomerase-like uncharacterized protein
VPDPMLGPQHAGMPPFDQARSPMLPPDALARAFYEPFNTGEMEIYDEVLTPDWADHPLHFPDQAPGREPWKQIVAYFRTSAPDLHVVNDDILASGDKVAVRSTFRGTHQGELFGIPPTGRPIEAMAIDFHRIAKGQIAETWHVEDYRTVFTQLGVVFTVAS